MNNNQPITIARWLCCVAAVTLAACEKDLPLYDSPDDALNFEMAVDRESGEVVERSYSFVYEADDVVQDTIWLRANTQGFLSDSDRPFRLEQIESGTARPDAVAGQHYVGFDDAALQQYYVIPAGANTVLFPVVVKRDASLADSDVSLYFQLRENEHFKQGLPGQRVEMLVISARLSKPADWSDYYMGAYGPVKHRFMIDHTGLRWDDEFVSSFVSGDYGYIRYIMMLLARELKNENTARANQGLRELAEADGREVSFAWGAGF